jgi:hypothetical protein
MRRVREELVSSGADVLFVDQRRVLESGIELEIEGRVRGRLELGERSVDLEHVSAAYVRPYDSFRLRSIVDTEPDSAPRRHAAGFDECLWLWSDLCSARVVNRPSSMGLMASKPRQAAVIAGHGFAVPETLLTTDPDAVRDFVAGRGTVVYKSISGLRSIVSRFHADDERLADVAWCPTQFQEFVPGDDYRVHVVGDEVYCSRVESKADDYRYGARQGHALRMTPELIPDDWATRCRELAEHLGLLLAGIDLRRTPDGDWYCFEVNASPAFTFYDRHGQGIGGAVAHLLMEREQQNEVHGWQAHRSHPG